ncbi:MAG: hypothetical protein JO063_00015 [Pseudonocardiales bacterium]|nr:hypothetical protein [Pseudonocardiales bacterium]MBV9028923.1 hypothetical protein [Pseudonocardiales bacterium]MBW0008495.1 hypothetical protein [Pseudonocardiales bacterium]
MSAAAPNDDLSEGMKQAVREARRETALAEKAAQASADRPKPGKRERVVLAERRGSRRVVRTLAEVEDQTRVGEALVRQLMWVQLMLSLRLMLLTVVVLAGIPLAFLRAPSLDTMTVLGWRLPWLALGFAVYPFFVVVAWSYNRGAARNEQAFAEWVES